jgi:acetyltransferase-like isoleucine patch superfamily enzyme
MLKKTSKKYFVHKTVVIGDNVQIGEGTKVWHFTQIREGTKIGHHCIICNSVYIDFDSVIGNNVKIQNHSMIYHKAVIEDGVFIGPNVCFTNDKKPRAINVDGSLQTAGDWQVLTTRIGEGASVGAHSVLLPGITIGKFAMIGAGSVVTKDIPDFAMVFGNPAKIRGFVCRCGEKLEIILKKTREIIIYVCSCGLITVIRRNGEN